MKRSSLLFALPALLASWSACSVAVDAFESGSLEATVDIAACSWTPGLIIQDDGSGEAAWTFAGVAASTFVDRFTPVAYPAQLETVCFGMAGPTSITLPVDLVVYADDGIGGGPGTPLHTVQVTATSFASVQPAWNRVDLSDYDLVIESGSVYVGARWPSNPPTAGILADRTANGRPVGFAGGYKSANDGQSWEQIQIGSVTHVNYRSLMLRASFDSGAPPVQFPQPYCRVHHDEPDVAPITRVMFAGIDNVSSAAVGAGNPAHEDFLDIVGEVEAGSDYLIAVEGNTAGDFTDQVQVYFDWNRDGQFNLGSESVLVGELHNSNGTDGIQANANVTIPEAIAAGQYRMRVVKRFAAEPNPAGRPCAVDGRGQTEDYTIEVTDTDQIFFDGFEQPR